jgi:hypothetical protein
MTGTGLSRDFGCDVTGIAFLFDRQEVQQSIDDHGRHLEARNIMVV